MTSLHSSQLLLRVFTRTYRPPAPVLPLQAGSLLLRAATLVHLRMLSPHLLGKRRRKAQRMVRLLVGEKGQERREETRH